MIRTRELRFAYADGVERLAGIDFGVDDGEIVVIDGPSGGGKSTLLRALCGLVPHFHGGTISGSIEIAGADPISRRPRVIAEQVGYLFQDSEAQIVFERVQADVAFGLRVAGWLPEKISRATESALEACGAAHLAERTTATLSAGERQRVALAGVLVRAPRVLLLDEPSAQLDPAGVEGLIHLLAELHRSRNITMVIADHHPERFAALSPRRVSIDNGRLIPLKDPVKWPALGPAVQPGPLAIEGRRMSCHRGGREVFRDLTVAARAGEITLICGPNGAGKSTLLRTLAGLDAPEQGTVHLLGRDVTAIPAERRFPRVAFCSESSSTQMLTESVGDELAYGLVQAALPAEIRATRIAEVTRRLRLEHLVDRHPLDLSVGQRELVALAGALAVKPAVLLLDEPTRALDPERAAELALVLRDYANSGTAVVVASHDQAFNDVVADHTVVLNTTARAVEVISA